MIFPYMEAQACCSLQILVNKIHYLFAVLKYA